MAHILAVDDSPSMRRMVATALMGAGHHVSEAADGREALAAARAQMFDLVVTDINMPHMDGITLVQQLRGLANYKFVPLLILTTEATVGRKDQGRRAGATGWVVKPCNAEKLLSVIQKVLGQAAPVGS